MGERIMFRGFWKTFVFALAATGCSARGPLPLDATHPASPSAAEAPPPVERTTLKNEPLIVPDQGDQAPIAGHVHRHGSAVAAAPYQCPMHPEVQSNQPGRCPKCGMELRKEER